MIEPETGDISAGRFLERYHRRQERRSGRFVHRIARAVRITTGVVLLLVAVLIGWLPGPGFVPLALAGTLLLASEVHWVAARLDPIEELVRRRMPGPRVRGFLAISTTLIVAGSALALTLWLGRDEPVTNGVRTPAKGEVPGERPQAGEREYRGKGSESLDAGAGISRDLPSRLVVDVERRDGCTWIAEYHYSDARSLEEVMCSTTDGVLQLRTRANIRIGPLTETQQIDCDPASGYRLRRPVRDEWSFTCASGDTDVEIRGKSLPLSGCAAGMRGVQLDVRFNDALRGTARYAYLLESSGLPIEWHTRIDAQTTIALVPVTYRSREAYRLTGAPDRCALAGKP